MEAVEKVIRQICIDNYLARGFRMVTKAAIQAFTIQCGGMRREVELAFVANFLQISHSYQNALESRIPYAINLQIAN